jgi:hypothetical protein
LDLGKDDKSKIMKRSTVNFVVGLLAFLNLLGLGFTGYIMEYVLPPGSGGRYGRGFRGGRGVSEAVEQIQRFWSLGRHGWGEVHFYLAVAFTVLMIIHIILHWTWIKCYVKSLFSPSRFGE